MVDPKLDQQSAYLLLRATLGLNIALHGVVRIIAGPSHFAATMVHQFASTPLPSWSVYGFARCLPWAEMLIGVGVLLGLATRWMLIAGALEILALTFGTTLLQDWSTAGLQLTYAGVYAALLASAKYNSFSIDRALRRGNLSA